MASIRKWGHQHGTIYSDMEKLQILEMYQEGYPWDRISSTMGRTEQACKAVVYGLRSAKKAAAILEMVDLNYSRRKKRK